jgi:predicted methyltransferase
VANSKKTKNNPKQSFFVKVANPVVTEQDLKTFANRGIAEKKFNSGIVKFSRLYALNKT